ncbi:MAG: SIMPL domain-containing protein [Anaerolineales bacterium]|nr:SIMPL domain-containing protein [Anaerolineales bacterium]
MSRKTVVMGLVLAAAILAGCSTAAAVPEQPCTLNCYGPTPESPRTLSVMGEGKVEVDPDIAVMYLSIVTRDSYADQAWDDNNTKAEAAIAAIQGQGVAAADIRSDFNLYQQEKYDSYGQPTGEITYIVTHALTVTVRDLSSVGAVLGAAQGAGVNSVGGISFSLEDPTSALSQARALAVANARARAEEIAAGFGVKVGKVLTVNEYGGYVSPAAEKAYGMGVGGGGSSVPVQAGTWEVSMTVSAVFEIE